jgi:hypothetical protein
MKHLAAALEAVNAANDAFATHTGRSHQTCEACIDIGVQLIAAQEAIEAALRSEYLATNRLGDYAPTARRRPVAGIH